VRREVTLATIDQQYGSEHPLMHRLLRIVLDKPVARPNRIPS
jgi:hypothetical protein